MKKQSKSQSSTVRSQEKPKAKKTIPKKTVVEEPKAIEKPKKQAEEKEVPMAFEVKLYDVADTVVAHKDIGTITKTEADVIVKRLITKKDTAVRGKLIKK